MSRQVLGLFTNWFCHLEGKIGTKGMAPTNHLNVALNVALLVKQLLPTHEIQGSNPVIGSFYVPNVNCNGTTKIKRGREWTLHNQIISAAHEEWC